MLLIFLLVQILLGAAGIYFALFQSQTAIPLVYFFSSLILVQSCCFLIRTRLVTNRWKQLLRQISVSMPDLSARHLERTRSFFSGSSIQAFSNLSDEMIESRRGIEERMKKLQEEFAGLEMRLALSGGPLMISDDLAALDEKSGSLLESIFSIQKAFPEGPLRHFSPDILEHRMPVIQVVQGRKEALVGIYNFEEHPRDLTLDVEQATGWRKAQVTDFYSGERREGVVGKVYLGQVEKHGSRLLRIQSM